MAQQMRIPPERHFGHRCVNCKISDFLGRRYTCRFCADYTLCGKCFDDNRLPDSPQHCYYHPMSVYYAFAEYELYFGGEPFRGDHKVAQSYKCALCDVRGLSTANLYRHLQQEHRTHRDHNAYMSLVNALHMADNVMEQPVPVPVPQPLSQTRSNRARNLASLRTVAGGNTRPEQLFNAAFNLVLLVVQLDNMDSTADDFPERCFEILQQTETVLMQHRSSRAPDTETIESFVRVVEDQVVASMADRRQRLGGFALPRLTRGEAIAPGANALAMSLRDAMPVVFDRATTMVHRPTARRAREPIGLPPKLAVSSSSGSGKAASSSGQKVPTQTSAQGEKSTKKMSTVIISPLKDKRFLCSKLVRGNAQKMETKLHKATFTEAIFCSMLADEELFQPPIGLPWTANFMSGAVEPLSGVNPNGKLLLYPVKTKELMESFYQGLAEYKTWMGLDQTDPTADSKATEVPVPPNSSAYFAVFDDIPYADSGSDDLESGNSNESEEMASDLLAEEDDDDLVELEEYKESGEEENEDEGDEALDSDFSESAISQITDFIEMVIQDE
ncbi:uncharacterized protein LOC27208569 [Drosophila simulans]|uniref:ZZ-type domain-containing protein n=1 Tax=Drosophila simulans TaxID=7240 RepID=A0A0J9QWU9_DROSI|nr:uncharacterized protein LOC27208569 [Drosophila simulans]KMY88473.1 uncharacterized protein Dsimw501_GD28724 [Drosophila simulans]